jgi:hypothetical protein
MGAAELHLRILVRRLCHQTSIDNQSARWQVQKAAAHALSDEPHCVKAHCSLASVLLIAQGIDRRWHAVHQYQECFTTHASCGRLEVLYDTKITHLRPALVVKMLWLMLAAQMPWVVQCLYLPLPLLSHLNARVHGMVIIQSISMM